jgi:hypothetical protein
MLKFETAARTGDWLCMFILFTSSLVASLALVDCPDDFVFLWIDFYKLFWDDPIFRYGLLNLLSLSSF